MGAYPDWLGGLNRTQVLGSTPCGNEFQAKVNKIPALAYTPKHMESGPGPAACSHTGNGTGYSTLV